MRRAALDPLTGDRAGVAGVVGADSRSDDLARSRRTAGARLRLVELSERDKAVKDVTFGAAKLVHRHDSSLEL